MVPKYTNALINETSPYLLQHAHNPVNWEPWSPEVLERAKKEGKPLLISIGYAACHWCHVMEHECFEDEEVAQTMNDRFINIKVDREERPDVDHIYMDALQMMTGSGGWPLNIVALPDGRPFWGATYVQKGNWIKVLGQLSDLYQNDPEKIMEYAENLAQGIRSINWVEIHTGTDSISLKEIKGLVKTWSGFFDPFFGGHKRAPKFMMPVNLGFLLHYGTWVRDKSVLDYVHTTLTRMAWGGIFDPIDGGFSRYSVDIKWHVPHFEKMLYDNAQMVSLYAQAYAATQNGLYKETVARTLDFVTAELMDENFGFYSSLDADSLNANGKLEEGAYYIWAKEELEALLGQDYSLFKDFYSINDYGLWEHGNYVLIRDATEAQIAEKHTVSIAQLNQVMERCRAILKKARAKRSKPRLDHKIVTSWNGLMLKGLTDAYRYIGDRSYLDLALKNAHFIHTHLTSADGGLDHTLKAGKNRINGYLEDYAAVIDGYLGLYETTFDGKWLSRAKNLTDYCTDHHFDEKSGLFFFTSDQDEALIRRTLETADNVVPSSNSIMAKNLFKMGKFLSDPKYGEISLQMLKTMQGNIRESGPGHANWLQLALHLDQPFYEIAIVGAQYATKAKELGKYFMPNSILAATAGPNDALPLFRDRFVEAKTLMYVCEHGSCKTPTERTEDVLAQVGPPGAY